MYKVVAYITAYQDLEALENCISALENQSYSLEKIYIVDNSPSPLIIANKNNIIILDHHPENLGISGGLKIGIDWAIENNYDFLWTFDQDSYPSTELLKKLIEFYTILINKYDIIGIIAPLPVDKITGQEWHGLTFNSYKFQESLLSQTDSNYYECDAVITSGSLINLEVAQQVNSPNIDLFIDAVDWDYCHNFKQKNHKIIIIKTLSLEHRFGNSKQIKVLGLNKKITIYNYSPLRYYYRCRNHTFVETRLAQEQGCLIASVLFRLQSLVILLIKIILGEKELKISKAWACIKGTYDGLRGKLGKMKEEHLERETL